LIWLVRGALLAAVLFGMMLVVAWRRRKRTAAKPNFLLRERVTA